VGPFAVRRSGAADRRLTGRFVILELAGSPARSLLVLISHMLLVAFPVGAQSDSRHRGLTMCAASSRGVPYRNVAQHLRWLQSATAFIHTDSRVSSSGYSLVLHDLRAESMPMLLACACEPALRRVHNASRHTSCEPSPHSDVCRRTCSQHAPELSAFAWAQELLRQTSHSWQRPAKWLSELPSSMLVCRTLRLRSSTYTPGNDSPGRVTSLTQTPSARSVFPAM